MLPDLIAWLRQRRRAAAATGMARALRDVDAGLDAIRAAGAAALPRCLVVGAQGVGKSSLLAAAGCVELAPGRPEALARWWRGTSAMFVDCGATAHHADLCRALRRRRGSRGLVGVLVVVATPDLLASDESGLARLADEVRDRLLLVRDIFALEVPAWLVLTKADHLGGFKEFVGGLGEAARRETFGIALSPETSLVDELARLVVVARTRRLEALGGPLGDEAARKAYQFPGQLAAAQRWIAGLVERLVADTPLLRGVHLASASRVSSRQPLAGPPMAVPSGATIFLETRRLGLTPAVAAPAGAAGAFVQRLIADLVPSGSALVRPVQQRRRIATAMRWALVAAMPMLCMASGATVLWRAASVVDLAHSSRYAVAKAREAAAAGEQERLAALDQLAPQVDAATRQPGATTLVEVLSRDYYQLLDRLLIAPCAERIAHDLDEQRAHAADSGDTAELEDLLRAYRCLGGASCGRAADLARVLEPRWGEDLASPSARAAARRHLDFLLAHLDDTSGWAISADRHLIARVEHELAESLWLRAAFARTIASAEGSFAPIGRDRLVIGPFRDALDLNVEVPGVFSQEAWDQSLRAGFAERARELSSRFADIGSTRPVREIEVALERRFAEERERRWLDLLASTTLHGLSSLSDAPPAIAVLTGKQSPYRELIAAVWKGSRPSAPVFSLAGLRSEHLEWVDGVLDALAGVGKEVERFLAATEPGKRSADPRRLRELADALDAASLKIAAAAKAIDGGARQAAVVAGAQGLLRSILAAASADVLVEQDRLWSERVRRPFAESLAGRYPFDPAAAREAAPEAVSRLFNPVSGTFWSVVGLIEELRAIRAVGGELLPVSHDYEVMLRRAKDLRTALFAEDSERINAPFTLGLRLREGVKDERAIIGDQAFGVYDRPDGQGRCRWQEAGPGTARIAITTVTGQVFATEVAAGPWAAVRLMRSGAPVRRPDGSWSCTWTFAATAVGRCATFKADAVLSPGGCEAVLAGDLLAELACPESIGR